MDGFKKYLEDGTLQDLRIEGRVKDVPRFLAWARMMMMVLMPVLFLTSKCILHCLPCESECGPFKYFPLASGQDVKREI